MPEALSVTAVRKRISRVVDEVVDEHRPIVVDRNRRDHFVMLASEDAQLLLEGYGFNPEVLVEPGAVSIWLPELALYGRGSSFVEAKQDLLDELRDYVDEYLEGAHAYLRAPNRRGHFPYVVKALLADVGGDLESLLFPLPAPAAQLG